MKNIHALLFGCIVVLFCFMCNTHEEIKSYSAIDCVASIQDYKPLFGPYNDGFGSGFFVNNEQNPYFMTNRHVITAGQPVPSRKISVFNEQNKETIVKGTIICLFDKIDIALLKIDQLPEGSKICNFENTLKTHIGEDVYYFGQPARRGRFFLYFGKFSAINIETRREALDAINIQAVGGNSGSPIMNKRNKCIGVLTSTILEGTQTFIVPTRKINEEFKKVGLEKILTNSYEVDLEKEYKGIIKVHF